MPVQILPQLPEIADSHGWSQDTSLGGAYTNPSAARTPVHLGVSSACRREPISDPRDPAHVTPETPMAAFPALTPSAL